MAGKKTGKRLLTWVLVLVMALSLLPLNVLAAGGPETDGGSGMDFKKELLPNQPDGDGNYTIRMTAQAMGKEVETTKVKPMDIVLVLDQSGSMEDKFSDGTRQSAMKKAVNSFIGEVAAKYSKDANHHMAIVTFSDEAKTLAEWTAVDKDGEATLISKISGLTDTPSGATNVGAGMELAQNLMNSSKDEEGRLKTVIVFTDGVPTKQSAFNTGVANAAISAAKDMKDAGVTIYTVGIFNGANPNQLYGDTGFSRNSNGAVGSDWSDFSFFQIGDIRSYDVPAGNRFLNYLSSNFENATGVGLKAYERTFLDIGYHGWEITENFKRTSSDYYMTAANASALNAIFKTFSDMVPTPSNDALNANTVITDKLSDYFTFATGTVDDVRVYAIDADGNKKNSTDAANAKFSTNGKTVTVTNYDFSKHYQGIGGEDEETLVIEIKVKPDTSYTNWGSSGEYKTNEGNATVTLPNIEEPIAKAASPKAHVGTYKVTYQPGEGSGTAYADQYYPNGATTKVKASDTFKAPKGYEFDCWKDEDGNTYQAGDPITFDKSNVTLTAQWRKIEAPELSVEKTVTRINGSTPTTDANGNITTVAYPGDTIEWTITVANSGNAEGNFTLKETLSGITVKDTAGNPVALSNYEWRGTVAANDSVSYTVTYTVQPVDVTDNGLVNTVTMNDDGEVSSDPVPTAQKYTVTYAYTSTIPTDAPAVPVAAQHEYGAEVTIENVPTLTGYTFHGWTLPEGLTENGGKFNMPAKNVTITGYWTKNTIPTYTFDLTDPDIIKVDKKFVSKYGRSAERSFTATATIEKQETYIIVNPGIDNNVTNNRSAVTAEPTYKEVGKATGTVTLLRTDKTEAFKFDKTFQLEPGDYRITVKETNGGDRYVTYDTKPYTRYFKVSEDGVISAIESITITNEYTKRHTAATPSKPTLNTGDHYAYVMGYPDGTVRPNGSITRAEVSAILFRLLSDKTRDEYFTTESSFTDVKAGAWYNNSIATLEKAGVIVDTAKGGAFRPNEAITRAELAAMLAQFSDAKPVKGVKFSDVPAEHWAYEAIAIAAKMGWIEGYPNGTFRPDATITRAEMMTLVNRALERVPSDEDHLLSKRVMLTFPDCKSGDWFYIAVQEATNSHTYERAATEKNGDEQWTALRANRDWTLLEK